MSDHAPDLKRARSEKRHLLPAALFLLNTAAVLALAWSGREVFTRIRAGEQADLRWRDRAVHAEAQGRILQDETRSAMRQIEERTELHLRKLEEAMARTRALDAEATRATTDDLARTLSAREEAARQEVLVALRADLRNLDDRMQRSFSDRLTEEERFRRIQQAADPSVFLIHCEFTYRTKSGEGTAGEQTGTGWGTGFVVSREGHIATNKHVVQPWKFDPELSAMEALGQIEILPDSVKLCAWPAGTRCLDEAHRLLPDNGYNNTTKKNLAVAAVAADHMVRKPLESAGGGLDFPVHELDNNDLVILKAEGGPFEPLRCRRLGADGRLPKLGLVMALGFPRGHRGLEKGVAETSPSLGNVRKVEDTIHITASIIPGNSGGPLFNEEGEVVGVATRIYSETLGICLKVDHALDLLEIARNAEKPADTAAR